MELINQINSLLNVCDLEEREWVNDMVQNAADYVQAVIRHEAALRNYLGLKESEVRDAIKSADSTRRAVHDALITRVDVVNRLCAAHQCGPIYTGDSNRKHYGDFALKLVSELFEFRH